MTKPASPIWTILEERELLACPPFLKVSAQTVELPGGQRVEDYYQLTLQDFALVYAQAEDGRVLMLRSYRHGLREVCFNFPGGAIAPGEPPVASAQRELLEETGFESSHWQPLGGFLTNANQRGAWAHFFKAVDCRQVAEANSGDLEDSELLLTPPDQVAAMLTAGGLASLSHVALLALAPHPLLARAR